ncbi:MAG: hypothetical protein K2X39_00890, partial [Silvanigrellaceae bacterium]|nr:hypothetical protein [Silvanigrellaceae bacterium]
ENTVVKIALNEGVIDQKHEDYGKITQAVNYISKIKIEDLTPISEMLNPLISALLGKEMPIFNQVLIFCLSIIFKEATMLFASLRR